MVTAGDVGLKCCLQMDFLLIVSSDFKLDHVIYCVTCPFFFCLDSGFNFDLTRKTVIFSILELVFAQDFLWCCFG